jgi:hypothetical protein
LVWVLDLSLGLGWGLVAWTSTWYFCFAIRLGLTVGSWLLA